jgi:catechol 2,3-dioxygenase
MIRRLGHTELMVTDLPASRAFYVDVLGFLVAHEEPGRLYLRGTDEFDLWTLSLTESPTPGLGCFSLRVENPDELEKLERLHKELGVPHLRIPAGSEPGLGDVLRVTSPDGHPVEFYFDMEQIPVHDEQGRVRMPMRSTHRHHGVPPTRIDHVNLRVPDMDSSLRYWCGSLDFSISEYVEKDGKKFAAWTRRKTGTHDVALLGAKAAALHHIAYCMHDPSEVIRAADLLSDAGYQDAIEFGPGRHGVTNAMFLYIRDPSGNRVELFFGDYHRDLDYPPIGWSWEDFQQQGRLWWSKIAPESFVVETTPVREEWPR